MKTRGGVNYLTKAEARALFDAAARSEFGVSGDEFIRKWEAGEYGDDCDASPALCRLVALLPFGQP